MTALSAAELAQIRADINTLLPDTCNILTRTLTPDGQGGNSEAWGTATASVACRLDPIRGREVVVGENMQPFHNYMLTLPHGTSIDEGGRVEVSTDTFTVVSVDATKSWSASVRAEVERL